MKFIPLITFVLSIQVSFAQPKASFDSTLVRPNILKYIDSIVTKNNMGLWYGASGYIAICQGMSSAPSKQYNMYEQMKAITKKSEWKNLLNHPNPEIRYYAFDALIDLKEDPVTLLEQEWNDLDTVMFLGGCAMTLEKMIDLHINNVWYYHLNKEEKFKIFLKCLQHKKKGIGKSLYKRIKLLPDYYPLIKEDVIKNNNPETILLLLKHKNTEDEPTIIQALEKIFFEKKQTLKNDIIENELIVFLYHYPKSDISRLFLEKLITAYIKSEVILNERTLNSLFFCVSKGDKQVALNYFSQALKKKGKEVVEPIYNAIENDYYEKGYINLFFELWEYESFGNHLGVRHYNQLLSKLYYTDTERTKKLINSTVEKEFNDRGSRAWFLAILICYQAKEYGNSWKHKQVKTYLNSDEKRLQSIAMYIAQYSYGEKKLKSLYFDYMYSFASDKDKVRDLINAIKALDRSNQTLLKWYKKNKKVIKAEYPNIIDAFKYYSILE